MKAKFENIFFDLDGTISDSLQGIENGIHFAFDKLRKERLRPDQVASMIGTPLTESLRPYFPNAVHKIAKAVRLFREYYSSTGVTECVIYSGIEDLLIKASANSRLYIITAKPTVFAHRLLEHHHIAQYFTKIKGCSLNGESFSKAALIKDIYTNESSIFIGDKPEDVQAGKESRFQTCGVLYGYGSEKEIRNACPDYIVSSVPELYDILF